MALEKLFKQPVSNEEEARVREGLSMYANVSPSDLILKLS